MNRNLRVFKLGATVALVVGMLSVVVGFGVWFLLFYYEAYFEPF